MKTTEAKSITVECKVNAPISKVWKCWTEPEHIVNWNNASEDWHTTRAENDLRAGGKFISRMEAKDGSFGFDFEGIYDNVQLNELIEYTITDGRKVKVIFEGNEEGIKITTTFVAESTNSIEMQRDGWQAILNNFKKYVENLGKFKKIHFEIIIDAKVEKVFQLMISEKSYNNWTSIFNPASSYKGTWEKGAKMLFLGVDENGNRGGMVSQIREFLPNEFVSIEHLGMLQGEKEITSGPEVESWAGILENYSFSEASGKTLLSVELDSNEEFKSYFSETWPKALNKLKEICEA